MKFLTFFLGAFTLSSFLYMSVYFYYQDLLNVVEISRTMLNAHCTMLSGAPPRSVAYRVESQGNSLVTLQYGITLFFSTYANCISDWAEQCAKLTPSLESDTSRQQWTFISGQEVTSSPVVNDGMIYFGSHDQKVYAIDRNGTELWDFEARDRIFTSPTVGPDGMVYVAVHGIEIVAITPGKKGKKKPEWIFQADNLVSYSRPILGNDNTIYVGDLGGVMYAVNAHNGTEQWRVEVASKSGLNLPVFDSARNTVYCGSDDFSVHAFHEATLKWSYKTGDIVEAAPAIASDGTVYVASYDGKLHALDPEDGEMKWIYSTGGSIYSAPAVGSDGTIYLGSSDGNLYSIEATGKLKWSFHVRAESSSPVVDMINGLIYISTSEGQVFGINSDGSQSWSVATGNSYQAPAVGDDGTVYVTSTDAKLYAFSNSPLRESYADQLTNSDFYGLEPATNGGNIVYYVENNASSSSNQSNVRAYEVDLRKGTFTSQWLTVIAGHVYDSPVRSASGRLYISSEPILYALEEDNGTRIWEATLSGQLYASPALGANGTVYVGSYDGHLFAINHVDGTTTWSRKTKGAIYTSPAVGPNHVIYIGSNDGTFRPFPQTAR